MAKTNIIVCIWCNSVYLCGLRFKIHITFHIRCINFAPLCPTFLKRIDLYKAHRSEKQGVLWLASYSVHCDWPNISSMLWKCSKEYWQLIMSDLTLNQKWQTVLCKVGFVPLFRNSLCAQPGVNPLHTLEFGGCMVLTPLICNCVLCWKTQQSSFVFAMKHATFQRTQHYSGNSYGFFLGVYIWSELFKPSHELT